MITKEIIKEILKELRDKRMATEPYLSEAQFQFELAWVIKQKFRNAKILLEYTACIMKSSKVDENGNEKEKTKRFESDIIVFFGNQYQVIELKYKTAKSTIKEVQLVPQGGQPGTKYDYLWDIHRIELLKEQPTEYQGNSYKYRLGKKCTGGYAIFLTNDSSYYGGQEQHDDSAYNFRLQESKSESENRCINQNEVLEWKGEEKDWMSPRPPFSFLRNRQLGNWESFYKYTDESTNKPKNKEFKYLITEIN